MSAQKGEKETFQSLNTLYYLYVSKFIMKLCGNEMLCEDLMQNTEREIWKMNDGLDALLTSLDDEIERRCHGIKQTKTEKRLKQFFVK